MNSCDVINSNITSQPCSHKPCKHAKSFEVYLKLCAKVILKLKYTLQKGVYNKPSPVVNVKKLFGGNWLKFVLMPEPAQKCENY